MRRPRPRSGFSLIEIMIAILFITIGFFGYVALHSRILHSGQRLEEREVIRTGTDFVEGLEVARITLGYPAHLDGIPYDQVLDGSERLLRANTSYNGRNTSDWKINYPPVYHPGLEDTLNLGSLMMAQPHQYSWGQR